MLEAKEVSRRDEAAPALDEVTIRLLPRSARFSLRLRPAEAKRLGRVADFALDQDINRLVATGERRSLRLGPDDWLLLAPEAGSEAIAEEIGSGLAGVFHALVDIGHREIAFEIAGQAGARVINSGCPLDLADAAFPAGSATRTLLAKAEIVLARPGEAPLWRVECGRSFAAYVEGWLTEAAAAVNGRR
ncbi:sarcosine oxidase subunit gamma [Marinimicrococcus flavescens]|uniref:Sarcosine oxidase subunit gamma family protein n=1 Tax=Marinimicrococcus flavescens TaxID=3031815 RepID=A0AAP3XQ02_9PROT|nr:sarcosine oxidase subunit gamma family protein [Marinimicrococcus flavescens]